MELLNSMKHDSPNAYETSDNYNTRGKNTGHNGAIYVVEIVLNYFW